DVGVEDAERFLEQLLPRLVAFEYHNRGFRHPSDPMIERPGPWLDVAMRHMERARTMKTFGIATLRKSHVSVVEAGSCLATAEDIESWVRAAIVDAELADAMP